MLVKTTNTLEELRDVIFKKAVFGPPIYAKIINEESRFYVFEEYTLRNSNYMTISVVIEEKKTHRLIHYVVGGVSSGILNIGFGAVGSRNKRLIKQLDFHNFEYEIIEE